MSRNVSATFMESVFSQETSQVFLVLLKIDHDDLAAPIRVARNFEDITHNGNTYIGCWFEIELPADTEDQIPEIQLTIQNVDRTIVDAVRTISSPATVTVKVVLASSPNTIEAGPFEMTLRNVMYNAEVVQGNIYGPNILNEPYPGDLFTPANFPGLF